MRLDQDSTKRIEAAVQAAEAKTSGEIVVSITKRSSRYLELHISFALLGWITSSALGVAQWSLPLSQFLLLQTLGVFLFSLIPLCPWVKRSLIPAPAQRYRLHKRARQIFWDAGLTETEHRTGVLILVSLLERRVEILADKGIHSKVGTGFWDQEVQAITSGIAAGNMADALTSAVSNIGTKLSKHFPPDSSNPNELPDTLREDD